MAPRNPSLLPDLEPACPLTKIFCAPPGREHHHRATIASRTAVPPSPSYVPRLHPKQASTLEQHLLRVTRGRRCKGAPGPDAPPRTVRTAHRHNICTSLSTSNARDTRAWPIVAADAETMRCRSMGFSAGQGKHGATTHPSQAPSGQRNGCQTRLGSNMSGFTPTATTRAGRGSRVHSESMTLARP